MTLRIVLSLLLLTIGIAHPHSHNLIIDHNKEIVFGMSGFFTGHFGLYGNTIKQAIECCFKKVNASGGVHGKTLRLVAVEDHDEPATTYNNVVRLYKDHGITMFIGIMGTRGVIKLLPLIKNGSIAVFFPWGGDQALRESSLTHIINGPGLLDAQVNAIAQYITGTLDKRSVGIFHADDTFSTAGASMLNHALTRHEHTIVSQASYNRFTMAINAHIKPLIAADPKIVACFSTSQPAANVINTFFTQGHFDTLFIGIDSTFLVPDLLRGKGVNFHYTSLVPNPITSTMPIVQEYRKAFDQYVPQEPYSTLSCMYYLGASILADALQSLNGDCSKEALLTHLAALKNYDFKGFNLTFNPHNRHLFGEKVWII